MQVIVLKDRNSEKVVKVVYPDEVSSYLTEEDKEMDERACEAVRTAIAKAEFLGKFLDL